MLLFVFITTANCSKVYPVFNHQRRVQGVEQPKLVLKKPKISHIHNYNYVLVTEGRNPTKTAVFQVYRSFSEVDKAAQAQSHKVN